MNRSAFLLSCSILALPFSPVANAQTAQDAPGNPPTVEQPTPLPANSDAAEQEAVRDAVAAKQTGEDAEKAAEMERIARIADMRKAAAKTTPETSEEGTIEVTGSRLRDGDVTTRLIVIDAQDIRDRGVTSVEELIRTLPQNVATVGAITNNRSRGPLRDGNRNAVSAVGGLGVAAANLGGVGAGNTLILVNGRRIAGAAGIEQGYANLNGIPLSAIERVEISMGGGSAVYGADALGGVINFILKRNYVGNTVSIQHEDSSGGADNTRISLYSGYAWGSGSASASVDFNTRKPIVNRRTGYVTNNYAPFFGGNQVYDRRSFDAGLQPGVVTRPAVYDPDTFELIRPQTGLSVPRGFQGAPGVNDFIELGLNSARDYVPVYAGPDTKSASATLTFDQNITDKLRVFANGLYTRTKNTQQLTSFNGIGLALAPGQFYNPFPAYGLDPFSIGTQVNYFPESEIADGTLTSGTVRNLNKSWNATVGVGYDITHDTKLEIVYTASGSRTTGNSRRIANLVQFIEDPLSPGRFTCFNEQLANNAILESQRAGLQAAFDRQCLALTSADPNVAFNPWKSTTNGGGSSITNFLYLPVDDQDSLGSTLHNFEGRLTGTILTLPAGRLNYAMGAEYARNGVNSQLIRNGTGENGTSSRHAYFAELTLPILGRDYTLPLMTRLTFNLAARRDVNKTTGPIGTVDGVPIDKGGKLLYGKNTFGRTTPSFGVLWSPVSTIDVRAKFTRGFKAPPPTQLFTLLGTIVYPTIITDDPLYKCTTDCLPDTDGRSYAVNARVAPNPDLKPETSRQQVYSISWQPNGALTGLNLALTYNRNQIRNQFATVQDLYTFLPAVEVMKLQQFFPRDASGKVISQENMRFNVFGSNYKSLTYEASYLIDTRLGSFQPKITYVDNITAESIGPNRNFAVSQLGKILGVDNYRIVGSLQWNKGPYGANLFVYHIPSYLNDYQSFFAGGTLSNPNLITKVDAMTTADLSLSWVASNAISLQFVARNILKTKPPFTVVDSLPYDTARYNVAGRTLALSAQITF